MNWENIYNRFLETRKEKIITEMIHRHHIIPRHIGGVDSDDNLIPLTIKDHAFAHWLLWKWKGQRADKVAWLMLSGKTYEGELERVKLAFDAYTIEDRRNVMINNNPMFNKDYLQRAHETRRKKYNGNYHSQAGTANLKKYSNSGRQQSPEAKSKRKKTLQDRIRQLTSDERKKVYSRFGSNNGNYGKKRPGSLAGNFGKSKGLYVILDNDTEIIFKSLSDAIANGYSERILKKYRNTDISIAAGPHKGKKVRYVLNDDYGKQFRTTKNKF